MTFDEFKVDLMEFIVHSNVNLGRKTSKTRQAFIETIRGKFDAFDKKSKKLKSSKTKDKHDPAGDRILCLKPQDRNKVLDGGKGVTAMTGIESMNADEQLNRSPFNKKKNEAKE